MSFDAPRTGAAVWPALVLQACTLAQEVAPGTQDEAAAEPPRGTGAVFYVPIFAVDPDLDETEPNMGIEFGADLDYGTGWGLRASLQEGETGLGALFVTTGHDEQSLGGDVRTYSAYAEFLFNTEMGSGDVRYRPFFGIGLGGAVFDFSRDFDDSGGAAGQIRVGLELELWQHAELSVGGAGFLWGYPGETLGTGAYATLELGIRF